MTRVRNSTGSATSSCTGVNVNDARPHRMPSAPALNARDGKRTFSFTET